MREITYHKEGDYYVPDLYLVEDEYEKNYHIGKQGHLRLEYLKQYKKVDYSIMLMDGTLRKHIIDTDKISNKRFDILMKQMLDKNPIDESLKDTGPLKWVGLMNNYKYSAEEIIYSELIYCQLVKLLIYPKIIHQYCNNPFKRVEPFS